MASSRSVRRGAGRGVVVLESCNTRWVFDTSRRRFRRTPRAVTPGLPVPETDWEPYTDVEIDNASERFTVWLNDSHTRLLRSFRHTEDCADCGAKTSEYRLEDLHALLG